MRKIVEHAPGRCRGRLLFLAGLGFGLGTDCFILYATCGAENEKQGKQEGASKSQLDKVTLTHKTRFGY